MYSSLLTPYADMCSEVEECSKYALISSNTLVILINFNYLTDWIIIHSHAARGIERVLTIIQTRKKVGRLGHYIPALYKMKSSEEMMNILALHTYA